MTKLSDLIVVCLMGLPVVAQAETVGLRSGDHDRFTRLVIQFDEHEDWVFGRVDGGFEFRPLRGDIIYRLDRVYDKIGRSRIADVTDLGHGRLFLAADCKCHGVVDELADGQVVLDIVSGPAREPGTGVDASLPPPVTLREDRNEVTAGARVATVPRAGPPRPSVVVSDRAGLPLTLPLVNQPVLKLDRKPPLPSEPPVAAPAAAKVQDEPDPHGEEQLSPPATSQSASLLGPNDDEREARIARTETVLLEQVARAAAQGLLDADMSEVEQSVAEATRRDVVETPPPDIERPMPPVSPRGHIAVETGVDRAFSRRSPRADETAEGDACIDPMLFDVSKWGGQIDNGAHIGAYRSNLVGEFDMVDGQGVTALARNYIFITFGAEAKALMRRYPDSAVRPDLLFAMAEIMDEGRSTAAPDFIDQMGCSGATALWATLAQPEIRSGQAINLDAVTLVFGSLPPHLRRHLGPGLAEKLLASGHRDAADMIRAATARAGDTPNSEYGMLSARFDLEYGEVDQAVATLDEVVATGDAALPEAVLQSVETTLEGGGAVPEDIVTLLDGLAFQLRGTETARQLTDAGIRARASASRFTAAFEQLDAAEATEVISSDRGMALREKLLEQLTQDTDDTSFLQLVFPRLEAVAGMPAHVRHPLAARLLDLGFGDPARVALGRDEVMPQASDRVLLARAALIERRPAVVIGYLAGLTDATASRLRAEALDLANDYDGAMRAHEDAGDEVGELAAAWRGGMWSDVTRLDQGAIGAAARLMSGSPQRLDGEPSAYPADAAESLGNAAASRPSPAGTGALPGDQPPLAAAQALIAQSIAARETLGALMATIPPPKTMPEPDPGD